MSLYLGSEIFDITKQPLQGEYSHLFVRQGIYGCVCVCVWGGGGEPSLCTTRCVCVSAAISLYGVCVCVSLCMARYDCVCGEEECRHLFAQQGIYGCVGCGGAAISL
jgi:uncharacterized membrane protein